MGHLFSQRLGWTCGTRIHPLPHQHLTQLYHGNSSCHGNSRRGWEGWDSLQRAPHVATRTFPGALRGLPLHRWATLAGLRGGGQ